MHGSISKRESEKQLAKGKKISIKCFFSNMLGKRSLPDSTGPADNPGIEAVPTALTLAKNINNDVISFSMGECKHIFTPKSNIKEN